MAPWLKRGAWGDAGREGPGGFTSSSEQGDRGTHARASQLSKARPEETHGDRIVDQEAGRPRAPYRGAVISWGLGGADVPHTCPAVSACQAQALPAQ